MKKKHLFVVLLTLVVIVILSLIYIVSYTPKKAITQDTNNVQITENVIMFSSLTEKQKLAQMIVVRGDGADLDFTKLNVGGIFLDRQNSEQEYKDLIKEYQDNSRVDLFVSTDLEGAWFPRGLENTFPKFSEIQTQNQAYTVGYNHGVLLDEIGFNMNYAPVSEISDTTYGGRTFTGTNEEIKQKIANYIQGLQGENILGTCKHYPGNALHSNLHLKTSTETITQEDLDLFEVCIENNISSIMISHHVAEGAINSNGVPSTVSPEIINSLNENEFQGLIIADEINMKGLTNFYSDKRELYSLLINAGNDLILDFELNPEELNALLDNLQEDLNSGIINQDQVDNSVKKILEAKGYEIIL